MFSVELIGADKVAIRIAAIPKKLMWELNRAVRKLAGDLSKHVTQDKLSGQVLHKITGRLKGSISISVLKSSAEVIGKVYSSTAANPYNRVHEYGARIKTRLGTGKGPPKKNGKKYVNMPERSYLRSSLKDYREVIIDGLNEAKRRAVEK